MDETPKRRSSKLGRYTLPTRAITILLEEGVDETNIDDYTTEELSEIGGFGVIATKELRKQRGAAKAAKRRGARTREKNRHEPRRMDTVSETREGDNGYQGQSRDPDYQNDNAWLALPGDQQVEDIVKSQRTHGRRLIIDVGPEHGLMARHAIWMERIVQNAPKDMLIDSLERLVVKLIRQAMANDPTKGGVIVVEGVVGAGSDQDITQTMRPEVRV